MTTLKITKSQLSEAIQQLTKQALIEAKEKEGKDTGVGKYAEKLDKFVGDQLEGLQDLVDEGEQLVIDSPTHDYAVQERNQAVMARIGILKALKSRLLQIKEDLLRSF